jgi:hypothetical protein
LLLEEAIDEMKSKKARTCLTKRGHVTPPTVTPTATIRARTAGADQDGYEH